VVRKGVRFQELHSQGFLVRFDELSWEERMGDRRGKKRLVAVVLATMIVFGLLAAIASAELSERGDLFIRFRGGISPTALPRQELAPIAINVSGTVKTLSGERPPALRAIKIELNRGGVLDSRGLPKCHYNDLVATYPSQAMEHCGDALVGEGVYSANTAFPEQATFPSQGRILAFNGVYGGREAILAHIYGTEPVPITRILVFHIRRKSGTFGTVLDAQLPESVNHYGYVIRIALELFRRYTFHGRQRSYVSAACAAPPGFSSASFPFARTSMTFEDGRRLSSTLTRSCQVRG
jgi:hypothetical protein